MGAPHHPKALAAAQQRMAHAHGKEFWRSLDELAQTSEFQELVEREFSGPPGGWTDPIHRRHFLALVAASLGLAGLSGCASAPPDQIVPRARTPEGHVPGQKQYFATAMPCPADAIGLLVESHEGRPTKIEGNPEHPACPSTLRRWGPTDVFAQASILSLYDPDRSATVMHRGTVSTWDALTAALRSTLSPRSRLRVLIETTTSLSLAHQLDQLTALYPHARWHTYDPIGRENIARGARQAFGEVVEAQYRLDRADAIVALDADFLSQGPGHVRYLHDFAARRRVRGNRTQDMNRLYVAESMPTCTGAIADHRLPMRSADIETLARGLAARLVPSFEGRPASPPYVAALARDLERHRGRSLVVAGPSQPPFVHVLIHALNEALGNVGRTVTYTRPVTIQSADNTLQQLVAAMDPGEVDVLVILGGNPVYNAPVDLHFAESMARVPLRVHLGLHEDETSALCQWHVPEAHFLESWGDVRAHDGTLSIVQPLIAPLYNGKTREEVLAVLLNQPERNGYDIVRGYWRTSIGAGDFESWWRQTVHDGYARDTQLPARSVSLRDSWRQNVPASERRDPSSLEINFRADPTIHDGRYANNGWLQELPKPMSKLTWDNAVYVSPATAVRLGFADSDHPEQANEKVVVMTLRDRTVEGPLWVLPGHADDSITVHLGYGRTRAGRVGSNVGFDANRLRVAAAPDFDTGVALRLAGRRHPLACTQHHHLIENRDLVRAGTVRHPPAMPRRIPLTLFNEAEHPRAGEQWGMVIDLNVCTGCSACILACQAENNIPVVGKEQVQRGREMHWLRVDRYFEGDAAHPSLFFQPVPCMHCENAPCELVCPVGATVHSSDGLNDMVYNRCVGTRYCSNNCPYKVRRFNFLQFADFTTESLKPMRNPEVSVRSRGVMEKCTYCVQRIRAGQIAAQLDDRTARDGEIVTACQAVCPARAITFGNINDATSEVARLRAEPLHYSLLEELNTRPRTTYLAALKNPNPEMPE